MLKNVSSTGGGRPSFLLLQSFHLAKEVTLLTLPVDGNTRRGLTGKCDQSGID